MSGGDKGQRAILEALWREHRRFVAAVLLAHLPPETELDDMLQEVAVAFCRHVHELRDSAKLRPWLRTIAVNVARGAGRKVAIRRRVTRPLTDLDREPADPRSLEPGRGEGAPPDVLELAGRLHPDYREPLILKSVRGLTQREIADALDLPETTVETRLVRARRMLRDELARQSAPTSAVLARRRGS